MSFIMLIMMALACMPMIYLNVNTEIRNSNISSVVESKIVDDSLIANTDSDMNIE